MTVKEDVQVYVAVGFLGLIGILCGIFAILFCIRKRRANNEANGRGNSGPNEIELGMMVNAAGMARGRRG